MTDLQPGTPAVPALPVDAALDAATDIALGYDAEWARTHPIGPTWTRPPRAQARRLIEGAMPLLLATERGRAEAAKAKLAALRGLCDSIAASVPEGETATVTVSRVLAIIGTEEKGGTPYDRDFEGPAL